MIMGYMTGDFYKSFTRVLNNKSKKSRPATARNARRLAKKAKRKVA